MPGCYKFILMPNAGKGCTGNPLPGAFSIFKNVEALNIRLAFLCIDFDKINKGTLPSVVAKPAAINQTPVTLLELSELLL